MPSTNPEPIWMWPWDVPEERGSGAGSAFANRRLDHLGIQMSRVCSNNRLNENRDLLGAL
jgi:hypothetical protein